MAVWLFPGCEQEAGGDSKSLQGDSGFGGPLQAGFGQPGLPVMCFWAAGHDEEMLAPLSCCPEEPIGYAFAYS